MISDLDSAWFVRRHSRALLLLGREHAQQLVHAALQTAKYRRRLLVSGRLDARRVDVQVQPIHLGVHRSTGPAVYSNRTSTYLVTTATIP